MADEFGRGRRAEIARELHAALSRRGMELLPGKARAIVDDRIRSVAELMRLTEPSAMRYLPEDWAEETATAMIVGFEAPKLEEQMVNGVSDVRADEVGRLIEALAVVIREATWQGGGQQISAAVGEPLDALSGLARSLQDTTVSVPVERQDLMAAARHLSQMADYLGQGNPHSTEGDVDGLSLASKLHQDAIAARGSALQ